MRRGITAIFIFMLFVHSNGFAQYFAAGNPFLSDAWQSIPRDKEILFSLSYQNSYSSQFFNENHISTAANALKTASYNYTEFTSAFGFTPKFSVGFELGYFLNKTMTYQQSALKSSGLGDVVVNFKYNLFENNRAKFTLLPAVGFKLPAGEFDKIEGNTVLPLALQTSSGNLKYFASIYMNKQITDKFNLSSFTMFEYAQLINSKYFYLKYGDQWMLSFFANYKLSYKFAAILQLRFESKDKSRKELDKIIESSGYEIFFISPQLNFNINEDFQLSAYVDLPVYRYYNGTQLAANYAISVRLLKKIGF
ncbi:MAG: transporter [Bacteroidetes bacterium]|nr:transporter [Bacteroidota bacterium]